MADLTEQSLLELLNQLQRERDRPLTVRPTHIHWPRCPTCLAPARYDGPYWMCDACKRVIGQDLHG